MVSQPEPTTESHPFFTLADKHKVDVDFRSFIHVEGVTESFKFGLNNFRHLANRKRLSITLNSLMPLQVSICHDFCIKA